MRIMLAAVWGMLAAPAAADAIDDWNARAVAILAEAKVPAPRAGRAMAMVQLAVFDALNAMQPRYGAYLPGLKAGGGEDPEAVVGAATIGVLAGIDPGSAPALRAELARDLAARPVAGDRAAGAALGHAAAQAIVAARQGDGAELPDNYRPPTPPGVYAPTGPVFGSRWGSVRPFAVRSIAAYRPGPPPRLDSATWRADLAEITALGAIDSKARTPRQTEDARFWLTIGPQAYQQITRQLAGSRTGVDKARFLALTSAAQADALVAVFDAKHHYAFWRPVTAIRAGGDLTWQPIEATPPHPEYPCAHCIAAASVEGAGTALLGKDVPEFSAISPTAPGVTHRWRSLAAFTREVSEARIYDGFHYRFSTLVAEDMGRRIGAEVAGAILQPLEPRP